MTSQISRRRNIFQRLAIGGLDSAVAARPDHRGETEPAIHRAAMHPNSTRSGYRWTCRNGRMRVVADRIGVFRLMCSPIRARSEWVPRDRIVGVFRVDQAGDIRRHGDGIARGDPFEVGEIGSFAKRARRDRPAAAAWPPVLDRSCSCSPAGGVHHLIDPQRAGPPASPADQTEGYAARRQHRGSGGEEILVERVALAPAAVSHPYRRRRAAVRRRQSVRQTRWRVRRHQAQTSNRSATRGSAAFVRHNAASGAGYSNNTVKRPAPNSVRHARPAPC